MTYVEPHTRTTTQLEAPSADAVREEILAAVGDELRSAAQQADQAYQETLRGLEAAQQALSRHESSEVEDNRVDEWVTIHTQLSSRVRAFEKLLEQKQAARQAAVDALYAAYTQEHSRRREALQQQISAKQAEFAKEERRLQDAHRALGQRIQGEVQAIMHELRLLSQVAHEAYEP